MPYGERRMDLWDGRVTCSTAFPSGGLMIMRNRGTVYSWRVLVGAMPIVFATVAMTVNSVPVGAEILTQRVAAEVGCGGCGPSAEA